MESVDNKLGYIRGLIESASGVLTPDLSLILKGITDVLQDIDRSQRETTDMIGELNDYVESIDDDLSDLEEAGGIVDPEEESGPRLHAVKSTRPLPIAVCPACGEVFRAPNDKSSEFICPLCGKKVSPELFQVDELPIAGIVKK